MSKFLFTCPQCNQQLEAEEEWIGMQTECPYCKQTITIEKPQASPAAFLKASAPDEKTCPFCGKIIKKEAVFCKHCKRDLIEPKKIKMTCQYCAEKVEFPENQQGNIVCPSCGKTLSVQQRKVDNRQYQPEKSPIEPTEEAIQNKITIRTDISDESELRIRQSIIDEFSSIFKKCDDSEREIIVSDGLVGMKKGIRNYFTHITIQQRQDNSGYDVVAKTSSVLNKQDCFMIYASLTFAFIITVAMAFFILLLGILLFVFLLVLTIPIGKEIRSQPIKIQTAVEECLRRVKSQIN